MDTPDSSTDTELLRAWSTGRCQDSFRALVAKYLGLVQGLAQRRTGDGALADEIAQTVFARLAVKAGRITAQPTLAPWLHHCAWCETSSALRRESTRRRHMNAYADHLRASADNSQASALHNALPHLDDALRALPREQRALASGGVPEAQRWFTGIPGDEHNTLYKQRAFDELISAMMTRDPSGAAEWITRMGRQEFMTGDALPELAARLASSSPGQALRWLDTLGAGPGAATDKTVQSFGRVLDTWSSQDPVAAGTWLQSHGAHPAYDQMAAVHARHVASTDGATALEWADSIRDDQERASARDAAARGILSAQGDNARNILAAAGYSEEQINKLAKPDTAMALYRDALRSSEVAFAQAQLANDDLVELTDRQAQLQEWRRRVQLDFTGTLRVNSVADDLVASVVADSNTSFLRSDVSATDLNSIHAHSTGVSTNCASCHR